jgi:hypothetical protein
MPIPFMVPTDVGVLDQVPPVAVVVKFAVFSVHILDGPLIGATAEFTVTEAALAQPVDVSVKFITAVPVDTPATPPPAVMLATEGLLLVHVPDAVEV